MYIIITQNWLIIGFNQAIKLFFCETDVKKFILLLMNRKYNSVQF